MKKNWIEIEMYNHMTEKEYDKNYTRVHAIMRKSEGDIDKAIKLAQTQANRITVDNKAISRFRVAEYYGFKEIAKVFMRRAYDLGQVDTQTFREWQIDQLLLD